MKRKKTQLEESLIEKGWYLIQKTYTGKHSDKVFEYIYEKVYTYEHTRKCDGQIFLSSFTARVVLDSKREKIDDILIETPHRSFLNGFDLFIVDSKIQQIKNEVEYKEDEPKKID